MLRFLSKVMFVFLSFVVVSTAFAQEAGQLGLPKAPEANIVGAGGEFTTSVGIRLPEFRNAPLPVALSYNSSNTSRGGVDNVVGFGWSLKASSVIERRSYGGGVPSFDDATDIYTLDGMELMACKDIGATATWGWPYPAAMHTTNTSASCATGGNMTSRLENFHRIVFKRAQNIFEVTRKDGTRLIYRSVGELAGETSASGTDAWKVARRSRWLLSEIVDTQSSPNTVNYKYAFSSAGKGYAPRLAEISYGPYRVQFRYDSYSTAGLVASKFATGTEILGEQNYRLRTIRIYSATTGIRAYQIAHEKSALSKAALVASVREYSADFTITSGDADITGGTSLPPVKFSYSKDDISYLKVPTSNIIGSPTSVFDIDKNGSLELVQFKVRTRREFDHLEFPEIITFSKNAKIEKRTGNSLLPCTANDTDDLLGLPIVSIIPWHYAYDDKTPVCFNAYFWDRYPFSAWKMIFGDSSSQDRNSESYKLGYITSNGDYRLGDFNGIPGLDLLANGRLYELGDGSPRLKSVDVPFEDGGTENYPWFVSDFTGDGISDFAKKNRFERVSRPMTVNGVRSQLGRVVEFTMPTSMPDSRVDHLLGYGDFDGDGLSDIATINESSKVKIISSTGEGFRQAKEYNFNIPLSFRMYLDSQGNQRGYSDFRHYVGDLNSDGLDDIVVHSGNDVKYQYWDGAFSGTQYLRDPFRSGRFWVLINNGDGFDTIFKDADATPFDGLVATGDLDGNGIVDFAVEGDPGHFLFGSSPVPNRMIGVTNPEGGNLEISYAPSSEFGINQMPGIQQMVSTIKRLDGRGGASVSSYSYNRGGYDFAERKTLGYRTVTENLPKIAGETAGPKIVTTYANDHFASKDRVISKFVLDGAGEVIKREINQYTRILNGNGPYRVDLVKTRLAELYGDGLIERSQTFEQNIFGEIIAKTDVGFTSGGNDLNAEDNIVEATYFRPNPENYIVDKPRLAIIRYEQPKSEGPQNLIRKEYYYDGDTATNGEQPAPLHGNLTLVRTYSGPVSAPVMQTEFRREYGISGELIKESNARGAVTIFEYDASNQFVIKTTSPLGHETMAAWDHGCQKPLKTTDTNGQSTVFDYDGFCREISRVGPDGAYILTFYRAYGDPQAQYIATQSPSGNAGLKVTKRAYFDGLGRVYQEVSPDGSGDSENAVVQISAYDGRGNTSWKSIPLPISDTSVQPNERTSMTYDGLNRPLTVTNPDGSVRQTKYITSTFAHFGAPSISYPVIATFDEDYDGTAQGSGEYWEVSDAQGRRVRQVWWDRAKSDSDAGTSVSRVVQYRYGGLGELLQISTDGNIVWRYEYDAAGNRIGAVDPGLGTWVLNYDANGNLTKQTDAKGQVITFTYNLEDMVTQKRVSGGIDGVQTTTTVYGAPGAANRAAQRVVSMSRGLHKISYTYLPGGQVRTETHVIADTATPRSFVITRSYLEGVLKNQVLPYKPGDDDATDAGTFSYDAAGRLKSLSRGTTSFISSISYNRWGQPTETVYGSGARDVVDYDADRGWPTRYRSFAPAAASPFAQVSYARTPAGRVDRQDTEDPKSDLDYTYDYAGRLVQATNRNNIAGYTQSFEYDRVGRMVANSRLGAYTYGSSFPRHAPKSLTLANGTTQTFTYDANGNMTRGLDGKVMTYDGENRPLSVTHAGTVTSYVYGADGTRLKRIETTANGTSIVTAYFGPIEIRQYGQGAAEQFLTYPHPNVRLGNGQPSHLHTDQLGSVRAGSGSDGARNYRKVYRPFGEEEEWRDDLTAPVEDKGFVGERYDAGAGLQYLNARYYDPKLALFIQPDWFEVEKLGVGTNRFAYSFNDPVNKRDPGGNTFKDVMRDIFGAFAGKSYGDSMSDAEMRSTASHVGKETAKAIATAPKWAAYELIDAYDEIQQNSVVGSIAMPNRVGIMKGDPLEILSAVPLGKLAKLGKVVGKVKPIGRGIDSGPAFYRGAKPGHAPDFTPRLNEYRIGHNSGFVKPTHGVSVFDNPSSVASKGFVPHRVDQSSIPDSLQVIQRGADPSHFEITPKPGVDLTPEQFIRACQSILCSR